MPLRESLVYTTMAGSTTVGPLTEPFEPNQESVYLNGKRLLRSVSGITRDYTVYSSDPLVTSTFDTIEFTVPVALDSDVIEVVINDPDESLQSVNDKLDDILTALIGSWIWDKKTDVMTMMDTYGDEKFKFSVKDSSDWASQERRQDLES